MAYLIDGHNLIGKLPGIALDDLDDEQHLIEALQAYCQDTGKRTEVYFDASGSGHGHARAHGRVTARYVRSGETADQAIARRLKQLGKEAPNFIVVSSDNQVLAAARRARARSLTSEEFAHQVDSRGGKSRGSEPSLSKDDIDSWLELFGGEDSP
ncbi:MAG: NYN domain-containing protein [Chloroflexota bacterium]